MPLPLLPFSALEDANLRRRVVETINDLIKSLRLEEGSWTAVVQGSGTAGVYEIATNACHYTRIGRRVWLDLYVVMAAAVTGGGTGFVLITGVPFSKAANTLPQGAVYLHGVGYTAGASISLSFTNIAEGSRLYLNESTNGAAANAVSIAGLGANDAIAASISYETDDP